MKHLASGLMVTLFLSLPAFGAAGDDPELAAARAKVIFVFKRLAGVPPLPADVEAMAAQVKAAAPADREKVLRDVVAEAALKTDTFYSTTVLDFAQIEASEERELTDAAAIAMNDLTATIIGYVRDAKDYRLILSGDTMYVPQGATYAANSNAIYETFYTGIKSGAVKLADPNALVEAPQVLPANLTTPAGILTLRGFGSIYYDDGTNRSPLSFVMLNYACRDMEQLSDATRPDVYVRRDVDRAPGGDASKFRSECVGCHAGMDPYSKAFAFIDFIKPANNPTGGSLTYSTTVAPKMNRNNDTFPTGAVVSDDNWLNLWTEGTNSTLGFDATKKSGQGLKSWGESIAASKMFPECMAKRVYKTVCLKEGRSASDKESIAGLAEHFANSGYNMKELFKETAIECAGKAGI